MIDAAQAASEQRRHKLSFHLLMEGASQEAKQQAIENLRFMLLRLNLACKVVFSGGKDVDIIASSAGKGKALEFVLNRLKEAERMPKAGVQVHGSRMENVPAFMGPAWQGNKAYWLIVGQCPELPHRSRLQQQHATKFEPVFATENLIVSLHAR